MRGIWTGERTRRGGFAITRKLLEGLVKIPPDSLFGKLLRAPVRAMPKSAVVRVRGGINHDVKWIAGSGIHSCWLGVYEPEMQRTIRSFVSPGMTVFDLGANAGFYTLAFSRLVGSEGRVWAFEPLAENANNLLRHVELNLLRNVTLCQAAVADRDGVLGFGIGKNSSTGRVLRESHYMLPAVSLDSLVSMGVAPAPDLIKIDVEGAEYRVLEGARMLLREKKPILFIALHGDQEKDGCWDLLDNFGYRVYLLDGSLASKNEALPDSEIYALSG